MGLVRRLIIGLVAAALAGGFLAPWLSPAASVSAADEPPPAPERKTSIDVTFTQFEWWMVRWKDNTIQCSIKIEHEGMPTSDEILTACGAKGLEAWIATSTCKLGANCSGVYMQELGSRSAQKQMEIVLPLPSVQLALEGCDAEGPQKECTQTPVLVFQANEPLPNESVIRIQGTINGQGFSCAGANCGLALAPTDEKGDVLEFWADSSFGDSSEHYTAMVRVLPQGDFMAPDGQTKDSQLWYVDVLSSQYQDSDAASCTDIWQVLPDVGGPPAWLQTPADPSELKTVVSYYYLAAMLIQNGAVDASGCPDGGLQSTQTANACGIQKAFSQVTAWQNLFDEEIYSVARETGMPAQLLKNVFSRESQLWPGTYHSYREAGLGQMTEKGADTVLLWNPSFYSQFCPLVLGRDTCELGFGNLKANEQNILRGALVRKVNASCADCPMGIDLTQANFSVHVFAEGMRGNCEQVRRIITDVTEKSPGELSSYVDLWKFTLVNYNAGSGCLARAVNKVWNAGVPMTWDNLTGYLEPVCLSGVDYVNDITGMETPVPTPTSWVPFGAVPEAPIVSTPPAGGVLTPTPQVTATLRAPVPTTAPTPTPLPGPTTPAPTDDEQPYP